MEEPKLTGIEYTTKTTASVDDDGTWKALTTTTEKNIFDNGEVLEESIEYMAMDDTLQKAVDVSTKATLSFLIQNVYQAGFDSLIEYKKFMKTAETKKEKGNDYQA